MDLDLAGLFDLALAWLFDLDLAGLFDLDLAGLFDLDLAGLLDLDLADPLGLSHGRLHEPDLLSGLTDTDGRSLKLVRVLSESGEW